MLNDVILNVMLIVSNDELEPTALQILNHYVYYTNVHMIYKLNLKT